LRSAHRSAPSPPSGCSPAGPDAAALQCPWRWVYGPSGGFLGILNFGHSQVGFDFVVVGANVLAFLEGTSVHLLAGCLLDKGKQLASAIGHEAIEVVGPQQLRFDQVRAEVGIEAGALDWRRAGRAFFKGREVLRRCAAANDTVGAIGERRLVDDGIKPAGRNALLLAPILREDVVDIDILAEEDRIAELLARAK